MIYSYIKFESQDAYLVIFRNSFAVTAGKVTNENLTKPATSRLSATANNFTAL